MLIATTIKCPVCQVLVNYLVPWKRIGEKYFHICEDCNKQGLGLEQSMLVAYHYGYEAAVNNMKTYLNARSTDDE